MHRSNKKKNSQKNSSKLADFDSYGADPRRLEKAGESFSGVKVNYETKYKKSLEVVKNNYASFEVPYYGLDNNDYVNGVGFCCNPSGESASSSSATGKFSAAAKNDNAELQQFYYHPDHLGSSSYLTNLDGEVVQHVEYVPFGEVFLEEKNEKWNTPYLFTSKELDKETGMYYFGARYQDPKLGIFMSVDPLAEKYAGWSSYVYALNNPVKFIDPDGKAPDWHRDGAGALVADKGDTAESLAKFKGISVQQARAEFNKNHYRYESTMAGGETFYKSERHVSSGNYGTDKNWKHAVAFASVVVLPVVVAEGGLAVGGNYLWSQGANALSQITWSSAAINMTSNATAQFISNGGKAKDINMVSTVSSVVPGIGPAIFGETITWTPQNIIDGNGLQAPTSPKKWATQVTGAIISNRFGKATDSYLSGPGFGEAMVREYFKGVVATGTNAVPQSVE